MPRKYRGGKKIPQERISERIEVIEVPKTSRQESVEAVVKRIPQDRISERSQVTELPKISCREQLQQPKQPKQPKQPTQQHTTKQHTTQQQQQHTTTTTTTHTNTQQHDIDNDNDNDNDDDNNNHDNHRYPSGAVFLHGCVRRPGFIDVPKSSERERILQSSRMVKLGVCFRMWT